MTQDRSAGPNVEASAQNELRRRAERQVAALKGFYIHLVVFAAVMLGLLGINYAVGEPWWALWVLLGWGVGVLAHALGVFGHFSKRIARWEKRKIEKYMQEG
jgi:fatty acid desaturase